MSLTAQLLNAFGGPAFGDPSEGLIECQLPAV